MCYHWHLVKEQFATRKITTLHASTNMTVAHCNTIYIDTANSGHNKHQSPCDTTANIHMIQTSIGHIGCNKHRSQKASVATDATFIHNKHLLFVIRALQWPALKHVLLLGLPNLTDFNWKPKNLYQTDKPQPELMQHLCSANIYTKQIGIGRNKYRSQQDSTHTLQTSIQYRQVSVATIIGRNKTQHIYTANIHTRHKATDTVLTIYGQ